MKIIDNCLPYCKICSNKSICEVCDDGFIFDGNKCCHKNCKTCFKEFENINGIQYQNCLSCNKNSDYKYLIKYKNYPSNCVEKCPEETKLDHKKNICIEKKKYYKIFYVFMLIFLFANIILIIIIIIYFKE